MFSRSLTFASLLFAITTQASAAGLIMPIYGNTSSQFNAAIAAARVGPLIAVINPDDGPGSRKVTGISGYVSTLKAAKAKVVGYIETYYASEALSSVYKQIDAYVSWYGAQGVYLDEMSDKTSKISYYRSIYSYAKKKGLTVVGNPGTFVPSGYAAVTDVLVTFEDPYSRWSTARAAGTPASKYAAIVYAAPGSAMNGIIDRALTLGYGWVFVSDVGGSDPFGRAPSFLSALASYVKTKSTPVAP